MTHRHTPSTEYEFTFRCRDLYLLWIMSLLLLKLPFKVDRGLFLMYHRFGTKEVLHFYGQNVVLVAPLFLPPASEVAGR